MLLCGIKQVVLADPLRPKNTSGWLQGPVIPARTNDELVVSHQVVDGDVLLK